jgi:hypothetical protein
VTEGETIFSTHQADELQKKEPLGAKSHCWWEKKSTKTTLAK